jgi:hypothetical protein
MDNTLPAKPRRPRSKRSSYKLDEDTVTALHKAGVPTQAIANQQGVARSTIARFLDRTSEESQYVEAFKQHRADVLSRIQLKALTVQEAILEDLKDGNVAALTPFQKGSLLQTLVTVNGNAFDKERLERGQSTQNISTISRMVDGQVSTLYKRPVTQPVVSNDCIISVNSEVIDKTENS